MSFSPSWGITMRRIVLALLVVVTLGRVWRVDADDSAPLGLTPNLSLRFGLTAAAGELDAGFGVDGVADLGKVPLLDANAVVMQADGAIVVAGSRSDGDRRALVARIRG
jgi:hypothetical protein